MRKLAWLLPALLQAAPCGEAPAPSPLENLAAEEADFRGCDRDSGRIVDFWETDPSELYGAVGIEALPLDGTGPDAREAPSVDDHERQ